MARRLQLKKPKASAQPVRAFDQYMALAKEALKSLTQHPYVLPLQDKLSAVSARVLSFVSDNSS